MLKNGKANQSEITFLPDRIRKSYKKNKINELSSVNHEILVMKKFGLNNPHSPKILSVERTSYELERLDFPLGSTSLIFPENIRRLLFTVSKEEVFKQLDIILDNLKKKGIIHRDINPGNLLFSEREKLIKLIDFYWSITKESIVPIPQGINPIYGIQDEIALKKIKKEILNVDKQIRSEMKSINKIIRKFGLKYVDGSSKHIGKPYHEIDIPYYRGLPVHRTVYEQYEDIKNNIGFLPTSFLDVGCANGYILFNMLRDFRLEEATGYEADPLVLETLSLMKQSFNLFELKLNGRITPQTKFKPVDVAVCLNVHMWFEKQFGKESNKIIENLINSSKIMFFQTSGSESKGMYYIKEFTSKEVIEKFLRERGAKNIQLVKQTNKFGGIRHLFKIMK